MHDVVAIQVSVMGEGDTGLGGLRQPGCALKCCRDVRVRHILVVNSVPAALGGAFEPWVEGCCAWCKPRGCFVSELSARSVNELWMCSGRGQKGELVASESTLCHRIQLAVPIAREALLLRELSELSPAQALCT